jgi:hypothetical protein
MGGMCALTQITSKETPNKRTQSDKVLVMRHGDEDYLSD